MLDYSKWDALSESGGSSCSDVEDLVLASDEAGLDEPHDLGALEMAKGCDWTQAGVAPIITRRLLTGRQEQELVALALQICHSFRVGCSSQSHSQPEYFTIGQESCLVVADNASQDDQASVGRLLEEEARAAKREAENTKRQLAEAREALQRALDAERRRENQVTILAAALRRAQCSRLEAYERSTEALRQAQEEKEVLERRTLEETKLAWDEVERQQAQNAGLAKAFQENETSLKRTGDEVRLAWEEVARLKSKREEVEANSTLVGRVRELEEALRSAHQRQRDMEQILHGEVSTVSQQMASHYQERDALRRSLENKEQALQDARRKCQEAIEQLQREREEVKAWAQEVSKQAHRQAADHSQEELLQKEEALRAARQKCQEVAEQLRCEREEAVMERAKARELVEEAYRKAHKEVLEIYAAETKLRLCSKEEVLESAHERQRELERIWRNDVAELSMVVENQRLQLQDREERLQTAHREREELQQRKREEVGLVREEVENQRRSLKALRERNRLLERTLHWLRSADGAAAEAATETEEATSDATPRRRGTDDKAMEAVELVPSQHKMEEATDKRRKALAKAARAARRHVEATQKRAHDLEKSFERAQREKRQAVRRVRRQQREEPAYVPCDEEMVWWKSRAEDAWQRVECQKAHHRVLVSKKDKALKCVQDERNEARRKMREELQHAKEDKEAELWGASLQLKHSEQALVAKEACLQQCVKEKEELESRRQTELQKFLEEKEELQTCVRKEQAFSQKSLKEKERLESRRLEEQEAAERMLARLQNTIEDLSSEKEAADEEVAKLRSEKEASLGAARQQQASALIGHTWQFQANDSTWIPFAPEQSEKMMQAFLRGQDTFTLVHDGATYEENLKDMVQTSHQTGKIRSIRCAFGLPPHWSMRDQDILQMLRQRLTGSPASTSITGSTFGMLGTNLTFESVARKITGKARLREFTSILRNSVFHHHNDAWNATSECNRIKKMLVVTEAYHVENIHLLERYQANCKLMQSKHVQHGVEPDSISPDLPEVLLDLGRTVGVQPNAGSINERLLFHGTSWDTAVQIAMEGFDSRLAKTQSMYGKGTYFAAQSCKSHQYAGPAQVKTMLLARVALGDPYYTAYCDRTIVRPPKKDTGEGPICDSLIARPGQMHNHHSQYQTHMEFVIFEQMQAYPEFILRYRLL